MDLVLTCTCAADLASGQNGRYSEDCNKPCDGDTSVTCGGPKSMNVYSHNGTVFNQSLFFRPALTSF